MTARKQDVPIAKPIRGAASPEARMRATLDLANSLPPSEFAAWLDGGFFTLREGAALTFGEDKEVFTLLSDGPPSPAARDELGAVGCRGVGLEEALHDG